MFDMNNSGDRRPVLVILGIIIACACMPTLLVAAMRIFRYIIPGILAGAALYYIFLRK